MERKGFTAPEITWQFAFRDQHYKNFFVMKLMTL